MKSAKEYILKNPIEYFRKLRDISKTKKIKLYFRLVVEKIKELF